MTREVMKIIRVLCRVMECKNDSIKVYLVGLQQKVYLDKLLLPLNLKNNLCEQLRFHAIACIGDNSISLTNFEYDGKTVEEQLASIEKFQANGFKKCQ